MRQLSEEKILANWNRLMKLIEDTFDEERKDNLLEMYKYFEDRMSVAPASGKAAYHLLNHFGIKMTEWEYIGLRLTDGLYEEANKTYLMSYNPDWSLKSNIAYILHQADMMATHIEFDLWNRLDEETNTKISDNIKKPVEPKKEVIKENKNPNLTKKSADLFEELFGDK